MNTMYNIIDWSSSDALRQLVKNIERPLSSIIEVSDHMSKRNHGNITINSSHVIFSNSQEIKHLIDEILEKINGKKVEVPLIFDIYKTNNYVQSLCQKEIKSQNISKQDISWLKHMENEIYKSIQSNTLNLHDLSYNLSVSERQLHRKIKTLVGLTPNRYVRILKLHKAKELIDNYVYDTISQISYAVGYYDTHYFSKLFNQQYNIIPRDLIRNRAL